VSIYPFIEAEKARQHSVKRACELLKVSRAACYSHLPGPSPRERADVELAAEIREVHQRSKKRKVSELERTIQILTEATRFFAREANPLRR